VVLVAKSPWIQVPREVCPLLAFVVADFVVSQALCVQWARDGHEFEGHFAEEAEGTWDC